MGLASIVLIAAVALGAAYRLYGTWLARNLQLDDSKPTPAVRMRDDVDYQPVPASALFPQHFSAIAAAGPIVGPILAGLTFGWLPALLWIVLGSIFVGGVHDLMALVASLRHGAKSIAEVVKQHISPLSYFLFLIFIWIALVYIIVAFTDITASSFVGAATEENGGVGGGAIAASSILYLVLSIVMGLLLKFTRLPPFPTQLCFVFLVGIAIWIGKYIPLDLESIWSGEPAAISAVMARKTWDTVLLVYCLVAGVVPLWLLLQPRGYLGGYFLYAALLAGGLGLAFGGLPVRYPAFLGFFPEGTSQALFPMLFITVACGACSGFHALIASGTTSKQMRVESDALRVGYGAMLLEGMVAVISLSCVMMFVKGSPELTGKSPNQIYAAGIGEFLGVFHVNRSFSVAFALMAFTTFVYDTLDVCTRLGRYILQELSGLKGRVGRWLATGLTTGVPLYFLLRHPNDAKEPVWRIFWSLFGASNQLLAALTLLGVTIWIWRTRRVWWVWPLVGIPTTWMYGMSTWALYRMTAPSFFGEAGQFQWPVDPVAYAGVILLSLAAVMLLEALRVLFVTGGGGGFVAPPSTISAQGKG
jgi:carbon starvation protein